MEERTVLPGAADVAELDLERHAEIDAAIVSLPATAPQSRWWRVSERGCPGRRTSETTFARRPGVFRRGGTTSDGPRD